MKITLRGTLRREVIGVERYRHTQRGIPVLLGLGLALAAIAAGLVGRRRRAARRSLVQGAALALAMVLFSRLTVLIRGESLELRFGPDWLLVRFPLEDVTSVRTVTNPWYVGWGIRRIQGSWLFNVSGRDAVELQMRSGRRYRIGTGEPTVLEHAIREAVGVK